MEEEEFNPDPDEQRLWLELAADTSHNQCESDEVMEVACARIGSNSA